MTTAFPLAWPPGWPRTAPVDVVDGRNRFKRPSERGWSEPWTFGPARDALRAAMNAGWRLAAPASTAAPPTVIISPELLATLLAGKTIETPLVRLVPHGLSAAAQVTEAMVEAACGAYHGSSWSRLADAGKGIWRDAMRAALTAALSAKEG